MMVNSEIFSHQGLSDPFFTPPTPTFYMYVVVYEQLNLGVGKKRNPTL